MAGESLRWQILDASKIALEEILPANGYSTTVAYVSEMLDFTHPEKQDSDKFPGCYLMDGDEAIIPWEIGIGTEVKLASDLDLLVTCMLHDRQASNLLLARTDLIRDVNKAITQNVTLGALLIERPTLTGVVTDKGFFGENYSVFDITFTITYLFTESEGG